MKGSSNIPPHDLSSSSYGQSNTSTPSYGANYYGSQQQSTQYQDQRNTMNQSQQGGQFGMTQYGHNTSFTGGQNLPQQAQQQQQQQQSPANTSYNRNNVSGYQQPEQKSYASAGYDNSSYQSG